MGYQASISYLYGLQQYGIKFGLTSISRILADLGNPHRTVPCVHIGGTNGKGSTAAFVSSILGQSGYKTGLYTSPHLIRFTERIKINGCEISPRNVVRLTSIIRGAAEPLERVTFFEFVTAMAFLYFAEQTVDCAIIEVGMGGRLDATNVVNPIVSIITNISREHESFLGSTILKIANEKAGIIKRRGILLTAAQQTQVRALFRKRCRHLQASIYELGKDFTLCRDNRNSITYRGLHHCIHHLRLGLQGEYQLDNGALALAAVEVLGQKGFVVKDSSIRRGLSAVSWPGRLETVSRSPLIILDGAHNPAAIKKLKKAILELFHYKRLLLIIGIMGDKNIRAMIHEIVPIADRIIFCKPHMDRASATATLASMVKGTRAIHTEIENVAQALSQALSEARPRDLICITGSLFTVGEAKEALSRISNTSQPPPFPPGDAHEIP